MTPRERYNYSPRRKDGKIDSKTNSICEVYSFGKIYMSYAEEIGVEIGETLIMTGRYWSVTTSKHKNYMRGDSKCNNLIVLEHEDFHSFVDYLHSGSQPTYMKWQKLVAQAMLSAR